MLPTQILAIWLTGLLAIGIVAGGAHYAHGWYRRSWSFDSAVQQSVFAPDLGWNEPTLFLALAILLFLVALAPAVLVGHSIGGMILLTFCRLFPEELGTRVAALVLHATTHTNPVRTVKGAPFFTAIETSVLKPLMYLTIALSPLVWLMNWMSYLNGSSHLTTKRISFGGAEMWDQIDFAARFQAKASPAVLARGMLGMMRYDATETMREIDVPTIVVPGEIDPLCNPEASERMRAAIPNAELRVLPLAKHLGFIEHHKMFAEYVQRFTEGRRHSIGAEETLTPVSGS